MKHLVNKFFVAAILTGCSFNLFSQDLPKIIKPSPEAAALFRFQDYPMDYSTGLPKIGVPICEIKSGVLSVPISISYHASGRKVYDRDGPIALGWSLNAGGMISREIYGSVDFGTGITGTYKFPFPFVTQNLTNYNNLEYLMKISHLDKGDCNILPWMDSEYDIFSYSFGSHSGKFFFKDNNDVKTPVLLPYKPLVVTPFYTSSSTPVFTMTGLTNFEITDENGILYKFGAIETYSTANNSAGSSWLLTQMYSPDKTDSITFIYAGKNDVRTTISQTAVLEDSWIFASNLPLAPNPDLNYTESISEEEYGISRLTEIRFKDGKILFNLVSGSDKVSTIQILNLSNEVQKTIQFNRSACYSQSEIEYATNKLDGIVFKDKTGAAVENYSFEYYPVISSNGQMDVRYRDWWGYYNNSGQHDIVPLYTNLPYVGTGGPSTINVGNPLVNRNPDLEAKKSGVLKKITFPTGGSTEFIYEHNQCTLFGSATTPINGPGLRLQQTKTIDRAGSIPIVKTYKYGVNESGYGSIELLPELTNMTQEVHVRFLTCPVFGPCIWDPPNHGGYRERRFYSDFLGELTPLSERPVIYTEVAEYHGTVNNNTGKTVYKYDYSPWAAAGMSPVNSSLTLFTQKRHIYNYNYWNNPSLISKTDYRKNVAGSPYQIAREALYTYTNTTTEYVKGLHVERMARYPQTGLGGAIPPGGSTAGPVCAEKYDVWNGGTGGPGMFMFSDYQIQVGYKSLTSSEDIVYNDAGSPIAIGVNYTYNSKQLPATITRTTSDGSTVSAQIKYPFDYTGNATLTQMVNLNMLRYPVEEIETKNTTTHLKSVKTNYFNWGSTIPRIAPQTIEIKTGTGNYETRLRFHSYDADGNITAMSKENDQQKVYIYGYNNCYPVAEIAGVSYSNAIALLSQSIIQNPASDQALRDELNKIRQTYPSALVTTFTYKPLIGVTSETDATGRTIFYEFDNYNRLKLVRDRNGNIIKTHKYQLQGLAAN
jgi:hypothetical protein